jgi:hypothetical protein
MPRTLSPETALRWINALEEIKAALRAVDDLRPCIELETWKKVSRAELKVVGLRAELLELVCVGANIETKENVNA